MRIVHINTFSKGGAAKAAIRQHLSLLNAGIDSKIIFLEGEIGNIPSSFILGSKLHFAKRILRKLGFYKFQWDKNETLRKQVKGPYEYISFPKTDYKLHLLDIVQQADIIDVDLTTG